MAVLTPVEVGKVWVLAVATGRMVHWAKLPALGKSPKQTTISMCFLIRKKEIEKK